LHAKSHEDDKFFEIVKVHADSETSVRWYTPEQDDAHLLFKVEWCYCCSNKGIGRLVFLL